MVTPGPVPLVVPRWRFGTFYGLGQDQASLKVRVLRAGSPLSGVPVEVVFQDDTSKAGPTDADGSFAVPYGPAQFGRAVVRIEPLPGLVAVGGPVRELELAEAGNEVAFALDPEARISPVAGAAIAVGLLGIATFFLGNGR